MAASNDHNKLVKQAAKSVLNPVGLFQKASTRMWIDDNGWYLTIVEFQPSMWSKGSYLNVALHYLWDVRDYLGFDYGHRVSGFVEYKDDEKFYSDMLAFGETAKNKVMEYRKFRDLEYAKKKILHYEQNLSCKREMYHNMMICGLCEDPQAKVYFEQLLQLLQNANTQWEQDYYQELTEKIAPIIHNPAQMKNYICQKILQQRAFWRTKSGMRKMKEEIVL